MQPRVRAIARFEITLLNYLALQTDVFGGVYSVEKTNKNIVSHKVFWEIVLLGVAVN